MSDWRREDDRRETRKRAAIVAGAAGLLLVTWWLLSRPGEETLSSSGFDLNSGGPAPLAPTMRERRSQTGLAFIRRGGVEGPPVQEGSARPDPAAGAAAPPAPAAAGEDPARLGALGVPTDQAGLERLVGERGLLSKLTMKVLGYPPAVKFLLNNKIIVDGLFAREAGKRNCESGAALQSYMMNGGDPKGVSEELPILRALLKHPESAAVAVDSEFGRRVMRCPSVAQLRGNPGALAPVVMANPALLGVVADPGLVGAVAGNPQAAGLLQAAQSAVGMGRGGSP